MGLSFHFPHYEMGHKHLGQTKNKQLFIENTAKVAWPRDNKMAFRRLTQVLILRIYNLSSRKQRKQLYTISLKLRLCLNIFPEAEMEMVFKILFYHWIVTAVIIHDFFQMNLLIGDVMILHSGVHVGCFYSVST